MNATNTSSAVACGGTSEALVGILMTTAGAALLALSMVVQRYALSHPSPRIRACGNLPRDVVWFLGLVLYGGANALKIIAMGFGAWAIMSSVWTTLLVFNLLFARLFLKEQITTPKAVGSVVIIAGGVLCVMGTPAQAGCDVAVQTSFSSDTFASLLAAPAAALWLALLLVRVSAALPVLQALNG